MGPAGHSGQFTKDTLIISCVWINMFPPTVPADAMYPTTCGLGTRLWPPQKDGLSGAVAGQRGVCGSEGEVRAENPSAWLRLGPGDGQTSRALEGSSRQMP